MGGGDEGAASGRGLHHGDAQAEAADDAVAAGEAVTGGGAAGRVFAHQGPRALHGFLELGVPGGIDHIHARSQHGDHRAAGFQSALGGGAVDALRQAGYDHAALFRQLGGDARCCVLPVGGCLSRPHHADAEPVVHRRQLTFNINHRRRVLDAPQPVRIIRVLKAEDAHAHFPAALLDGLGLGNILVLQRPQVRVPQAFHPTQVGRLCQEQLPCRAHGAQAAPGDPWADARLGQPEPIAKIRHAFPSPDRPPT